VKRTLEQGQGCTPATMMEGLSKRGVIRTLEEAKVDILELHAEMAQLRDMVTDNEIVIGLIATQLSVDPEPHQTFPDRLIQAARDA